MTTATTNSATPSGENLFKAKGEKKKKNKSAGQKRRSKAKGSESKGVKFDQFANEASMPDNGKLEKEQRKLMRMKKRENDKRDEAEVAEIHNEVEDTYDEKNGADTSGEKKRRKLREKKIKNEKLNKVGIAKGDELYNEVEDCSNAQDGRKLRKKKRKNEKFNKVEMGKVDELYNEVEDGSNALGDDRKMGASQSEGQGWIESAEPPTKTRKSKKAHKIRRKDRLSSEGVDCALEKSGQAEEGVYQISSGDEDCSRGMKKWITEHYQSRPGLKVLQQRIDDFITAHDAQEEQARKEREAQAADGGWTVVVHHKGRKKTTDSESGITVGSVAPEAVMDKMAKKKSKEVGLDFYRFQKREAQRNEIMMLQSKFEEDKKRIQQLRAARKFRPY